MNEETQDGTPIAEIGEFGLIDRMELILGEPADPDLLIGIGDDAAVYRVGERGVHVLTTDALIEGVHFDLSYTPLEHLGLKALIASLSDVVAMNAEPRYATVALGIPPAYSVEMIEQLYRGMRKVCDAYSIAVVGGDVTSSRQLTISVTAVGDASEADVVYRRGATPGDIAVVTGDLGGSYAGLRVLLEERRRLLEEGDAFVPQIQQYRHVVNRHLTPVARLGAIRAWQEAGLKPSALIDVSDGLASEIHHICKASRCGAVLEEAAIPMHGETARVAESTGRPPALFALFGGEDYELLAAFPAGDEMRLEALGAVVVGQFTDSAEGVRIVRADGTEEPLKPQGFDHFSPD